VLYAGDLVFRGRIPFVGQADSRNWILSLERLLAFDAGHRARPRPASTEARKDMQLTRDYLVYLRKTMGEAARDMTPFDEAYQATDWSAFEHLPLFGAGQPHERLQHLPADGARTAMNTPTRLSLSRRQGLRALALLGLGASGVAPARAAGKTLPLSPRCPTNWRAR
jgi:hypothetical protein